jgi:hypothetical protein
MNRDFGRGRRIVVMIESHYGVNGETVMGE